MNNGLEERKYWVDTLIKIISPVLTCGAARELKQRMPKYNAALWDRALKDKYAYLEAVGRTLCGAAPWLETPQLDPEEEAERRIYAEMARKTIDAITDPASPDKAEFYVSVADNGGNPYSQALVDAAFLAHAIVRAKTELFDKLEPRVKRNLITCLMETRGIRPAHNNWMLFSGMVEAALYLMGETPDLMRVDACLFQHEQWYKGDGVYGDGAAFHWDYYNSYVIQPMFVDICRVFADEFPEGGNGQKRLNTALARAARYAVQQERLIAPDGTFPVIGRSITYRTGAFQLLAQAVLEGFVPDSINKGGIRAALTKVIHRCFDSAANFDTEGWLKIGLCGDQPSLGELYICTGSLYLCTAGFLPLGLPADNDFWTCPPAPHTSVRVWAGEDLPADHSI